MFNQRQWEQLNAFTASFSSNSNGSGNSNNQPTSPFHQVQQEQQTHQHQQLGHQPQQPPHYVQRPHQQQPSTPGPHQQLHQQQSHGQLLQYEFSPQQEWSGFEFNLPSTSNDVSHAAHQHDGPSDFSVSTTVDVDMDWTPSNNFSDDYQRQGFGGFHHDNSSGAVHIKSEHDDNFIQSHGSSQHNGGDGSGNVNHLVAGYESKAHRPPLPPRPADSVVTANSVTSPIAISHQQPSHPNNFNTAAEGTSFASNSFASQSFASNRVTTPGDSSIYGSFGTSLKRVTSPLATSPHPHSLHGYHDVTQVTSPGPGATNDPFGSLDDFVNSSMGHNVASSPMMASPAPTTPGHSTAGTPGFAVWRPPGQTQSQPPRQPSYPQFHHQPQQHYTHQSHQPSPAPPQHPSHPQDIRSPGLQSNNPASPGGYFHHAVAPSKATLGGGNQFILELNPGSKAKGKAPAKPPKPKTSKPSISLPTPSTPFIKEEPATPGLSNVPSAVDSITEPNDESRGSLLNRPAREQVPAEAWEGYKTTIRDLYLEQRKPLKEVMSIMAEKYNFQATPKMYKTRFSQWGFVKNNTEDEVKKLLSMKFQRDAEGKVSEFVRNGKIVNLGTYLKRKGVTEYDLVDFELPANLPSHIRCRTPTPPPAPEWLKSPDLMRAQELVISNMRKAFMQCRQWELETERQVGWPSIMVWGAPSSEMLLEANFYFEAKDADSGGQCLMNAFNQLEIDLKQLSPQAILEVLLAMVRRDPGLMTALCKYVAAFSTTNYDRSHPLRQIFTCLYEVQQKHGAITLSELLWNSTPQIAEELEAIYGRRHPYVARTWIDLAIFYDQRNPERLEKLSLELRMQHKQMSQGQGTDLSDLLALRYAIAQLCFAADAESSSAKQAANDLVKDMKKGKLLHRVRNSRSNVYCYHCAVKNDPWSKRCRRRYDSIVELLEKHTDVKVQPYFEEDFHTTEHELEPAESWKASLVNEARQSANRWGFF